MDTPTNNKEPTGGVHNPMQRLTTMMIPKCTGSTPTLVTTGKKMGVKINTAGVISMNVPINNKIRLITSKITHLLSLKVSMKSLINWGMSSADITQDMLMEVPIKSNTTAVVSDDRTKIPGSPESFNSRYKNESIKV